MIWEISSRNRDHNLQRTNAVRGDLRVPRVFLFCLLILVLLVIVQPVVAQEPTRIVTDDEDYARMLNKFSKMHRAEVIYEH